MTRVTKTTQQSIRFENAHETVEFRSEDGISINATTTASLIQVGPIRLTVAQARKLRDWLADRIWETIECGKR